MKTIPRCLSKWVPPTRLNGRIVKWVPKNFEAEHAVDIGYTGLGILGFFIFLLISFDWPSISVWLRRLFYNIRRLFLTIRLKWRRIRNQNVIPNLDALLALSKFRKSDYQKYVNMKKRRMKIKEWLDGLKRKKKLKKWEGRGNAQGKRRAKTVSEDTQTNEYRDIGTVKYPRSKSDAEFAERMRERAKELRRPRKPNHKDKSVMAILETFELSDAEEQRKPGHYVSGKERVNDRANWLQDPNILYWATEDSYARPSADVSDGSPHNVPTIACDILFSTRDITANRKKSLAPNDPLNETVPPRNCEKSRLCFRKSNISQQANNPFPNCSGVKFNQLPAFAEKREFIILNIEESNKEKDE